MRLLAVYADVRMERIRNQNDDFQIKLDTFAIEILLDRSDAFEI